MNFEQPESQPKPINESETPTFGSEEERQEWEGALNESQELAKSIESEYSNLDEGQKKEKWEKVKDTMSKILMIAGASVFLDGLIRMGIDTFNQPSLDERLQKISDGITDSLNSGDPNSMIIPMLVGALVGISGLVMKGGNKDLK